MPHKEKQNKFAKWLIAISTDHTFGSFEYGDSYIRDAIHGLKLVEFTDKWYQYYGPGFSFPGVES